MDIALAVDTDEAVQVCRAALTSLGYEFYDAEANGPGNSYFVRGREVRTHQAHLWRLPTYGWDDHLYFQDRLRAVLAERPPPPHKTKKIKASRGGNCRRFGATIRGITRYSCKTTEEEPAMLLRFRPFGLLLPAALLSAALLPLAAHSLPPKAKGAAPAPRLTPANSALYIANVGDGTVMRCNGVTGKVISVLGKGMNPVGLAFGPDRNLYVTSFFGSSIQRFNPYTGASLGTFIPKGSGGMSIPITMAFEPADHNLYVVTNGMGGGDIRRYNGKTGAPLGLFVPHGRGGLVDPGDITFGRDGNLYVTNNSANSIMRFNGKTGASLGAFVKPGSGGLKNPQNITFGPGGDLYAGGDSGVLQFSGKTGAFVRVFAAPDSHLSNVGGLTFGPDGDLYVGDWQKNDVLRYDGRTAAFKGVFVKPGSGLLSNRYILFGPRGSGGASPAMAAAASAKRVKAMRAARAAARASEPALLADGSMAPDFTVQDKAGSPVKLSDYRGKVVVIDFWSTWCGPCQLSLPHTNDVAKQFADKGVVVLAVNVWDKKAAFDEWLPKHPEYDSITFVLDPTLEHGKDVATRLYNVSGIPTQYVVGKDGKVLKSFVGYGGPTSDLADALTAAIAAPAAQTAAAPPQPKPLTASR